MLPVFLFRYQSFPQKHLDMAVISCSRHHFSLAQVVYAAVSNVRPVGFVFLNQRNCAGCTGASIDWQSAAQFDHGLVSVDNAGLQEVARMKNRVIYFAVAINHHGFGKFGSPGAGRVSAHAVNDYRKYGFAIFNESNTILIFITVANQTQANGFSLHVYFFLLANAGEPKGLSSVIIPSNLTIAV
jgi:hypothetical protein